MNYLITTNYYPINDYKIENDQIFKIVTNPYFDIMLNFENLDVINSQPWAYSIAISDTYRNIKDLILFHSFITDNYSTYHYAESCHKLLFEDDKLEYVKGADLDKKIFQVIDFSEFPLLLTCNRIASSEMKYEKIDYKNSFEKFLKLKDEKKTKGSNGKYNLYDLISLYEFARCFDRTHKLYSNSNMPISFYITIFESLIGKPENCEILHCDKCNQDIPHYKISLEKHFQNHFSRYREMGEIRKIRHKTYHEGASFDLNKHISVLMENKCNWSEDPKYLVYTHKKEEMECLIRVLLTKELLKYIRK